MEKTVLLLTRGVHSQTKVEIKKQGRYEDIMNVLFLQENELNAL